jgi:putative transposase
MPEGDTDYSMRIAGWKRRFTRSWLASGGREGPLLPGEARQRCRGVWQRRFWEHTIRDAADFHRHVDYIHINPVKHELAQRPADWPWSTFHRYLRQGRYEPDWYGQVDLPGNVEYIWAE